MSTGVCTSRLAFKRCPPSIPKKKRPAAVFLHFPVPSNLSFGFHSGSKNQTRFSSKLVPSFNVSRRRVNQLECFWVQFGAISVLVLIQVLKIRPGSGRNWFHFFYVSRRRVNKLECFWVPFRPISVSVLIQVLKIRPGSGRNWFHFFMFPEEE